MKIAMVGCGAYSLAVSLRLNQNNNNVTIWSESKEKVDLVNKKHQLNDILKGVKIPKEIEFTTSLEECVKDRDVIYVIVAAQYIYETMNNIKKFINHDSIICIGTKGIEQESCKFIHQITEEVTKCKHVVVISGPSFAIDVANNNPVALTLASKSKDAIAKVSKTLNSPTVKLQETQDVVGVEICGAIKNVIAIAAGIINGLGYQESTLSFLITESMYEIKNIIKHLNGDEKTILSYAGIGDIILTCTSTKSRNFSFGKFLINATLNEKNNYLIDNTVEGYSSLNSISKILSRIDVESELINTLYDIVFKNEDPNILIEWLNSSNK